MKKLLLLVLLCYSTIVGAQELFSVKSESYSLFDLDTELPQLDRFEGNVNITYYETRNESYMHVDLIGHTAMFKVVNIDNNVEGKYLNFLMIEARNDVEDTLLYVFIPKELAEYFIVVIVQPNKKIAIQCPIKKSTT